MIDRKTTAPEAVWQIGGNTYRLYDADTGLVLTRDDPGGEVEIDQGFATVAQGHKAAQNDGLNLDQRILYNEAY